MKTKERWKQSILILFLTAIFFVENRFVQISHAQTDSPSIHMIIVADLSEPELGVKVDLKRWCREFYEIKFNTGVTPKITLIARNDPWLLERAQQIQLETGTMPLKKNYDSKTVKEVCDQLTVNKKDTILFYFGGHGFRTGDRNEKWPSLLLPKKINGRTRKVGLPVKTIFKTLSAKKPRLLIVLADCCNNWLPADVAPPAASKKAEDRKESYKKLFLQSSGHFLVSGCLKGQKSRSNSRKGGFFTSEFFQQLEDGTVARSDRLSQQPPTWDSILKRICAKKIWVNPKDSFEFQKAQWQRMNVD